MNRHIRGAPSKCQRPFRYEASPPEHHERALDLSDLPGDPKDWIDRPSALRRLIVRRARPRSRPLYNTVEFVRIQWTFRRRETSPEDSPEHRGRPQPPCQGEGRGFESVFRSVVAAQAGFSTCGRGSIPEESPPTSWFIGPSDSRGSACSPDDDRPQHAPVGLAGIGQSSHSLVLEVAEAQDNAFDILKVTRICNGGFGKCH